MGVEREVEEGEECRGGMMEGEVEAGVAGGVGEARGEGLGVGGNSGWNGVDYFHPDSST